MRTSTLPIAAIDSTSVCRRCAGPVPADPGDPGDPGNHTPYCLPCRRVRGVLLAHRQRDIGGGRAA